MLHSLISDEGAIATGAKIKNLPKHRLHFAKSGRIGVLFLVTGLVSLAISFLSENSALAFVGLGCTFWGAIFFLIMPTKYVEGSLLESTIESSYMTIDRVMRELKCQTTSYCIPPYPQGVYLPEHLKGLKEAVVFIPAEDSNELPSLEEISKGKFQVENPKGILVNPPGIGLLERIEGKLHKDSSEIAINELYDILPRIICADFNLAKGIILSENDNIINLRIYDSIYKNLYGGENRLKSINVLGCPIVNAIACALCKSSGRSISIQEIHLSPKAIDISYHIMNTGDG